MTSWVPQRPEYYVQTGSMFENPHGVPHDEIVRMILENPPEVTAQTVFGKYVESSGLVFTGELIQMMIDRSLPRVLGNFYVDKQAVEDAKLHLEHNDGWWGDRYHTGVDFARQTDYTVISTLDTLIRPARLVYFKRLNRVPWEAIYAEVGRARELFGENILCDSTGMGGDVVMDALDSRAFCTEHRTAVQAGQRCLDPVTYEPRGCLPATYLPLSCCSGLSFSTSNKKELLDHLRVVLSSNYDVGNPDRQFGDIRIPPIVQLEEEMTFYTWVDKGLQTDCLFSLALAAWSGLEESVGASSIGSPYGS